MTTPALNLSKLHITRYRPDIRFLPDKGMRADEIDLGSGVVEISILKRFDLYLFPYVRIKCVLSPRETRRLQTEYERGSIFLSLEKYTNAPDDEEDGVDTGEKYWNHVEFSILGIDTTPIPVLMNNPSTEEPIISTIEIEMVPRSALEIGRKVNNRIFHSIRLLDALVAIFGERIPPTGYRYLISPPDSWKTYENIIIPPFPLSEMVSYLNEVYGLYKNSLIFFLDTDTGYLLSADKPLQDNRLLPIKEVQMELFGSPQGIGGYGINNGGFDDFETGVYHMRSIYEPHLEYQNNSLNEVIGEKMKFIRDSTETMHLRANENASRLGGKRGSEKERIIWQRYDNDFYGEAIAARKREKDFYLTIVGESIDLKYLVPHLPFRVVSGFEEMSSLEGNWRPVIADIRLVKEPESRSPMDVYYTISMVKRSK